MLFNNSTDESFALLGEFLDFVLNSYNCSKGDILELFLVIFACNENYIVGI